MAGLLDDIFNSPEGRMGLGLLALGQMPKSQGFPGLMGLLASQDAAAKSKQDGAWQEEARGRQRKEWAQADAAMEQAAKMKALEQQFFFGGGPGAGSVGGTSAPAVQGAGVIPSGGGAQMGGKIKEWSEQLGIPQDAIIADYLKNGGKGIAEMLYKRGTPDMQVTNGYAYDKNKLGAGFMPSLQTSQDGKSTMTRIGPDGLPVVSAPQGAMETYAGYQGAQAAFKPIKVYNPATGREEYTNEGAVVRGQPAQPQYSGPGYAGGSAAAAAPEQLRIMQSELDKLPANHPDRPAIMREMQRLGGGQVAQSGNFAAGPSAAESATADANRTKLVEQAKADVKPTDSRLNSIAGAKDMLSVINRLQSHPGRDTATGVSGMLDPRNYFPGTDAKDFHVALDQLKGKTFLQAFESLKGAGAITENEGVKASNAMARLNTAQSDRAFNEALSELHGIVSGSLARQEASAGRNGVQAESPQPAQREFSMLPKASDFDGKRMRAPDGTIYRSSGGRWNKE